MNKAFSLLSACLLVLFLTPVSQASSTSLIPFAEGAAETSTSSTGMVSALSDLRSAESQLREIELEITTAQSRVFPQREEISDLIENEFDLQQELQSLQDRKASIVEPSVLDEIALTEGFLQGQISQTQSARELLETELAEAQAEQEASLQFLEQQLITAQEQVTKYEALVTDQAISLAVRVLIFIGIVLSLILLRMLLIGGINRIENLPFQRRETLIRLSNALFLGLIFLTVIVGAFSQFVNVLPVLAILGTALAFALRGILTSFIGWFVIGTGNGYKIGDLIEVGEHRGRVIDITPLLTQLRQTGMRGDTGRIMTLPNNAIFEQPVINYSKLYRFTYLMLDFLLTPESNLQKAREILTGVIEENNTDQEEANKNRLTFQKTFGIRQDNLEPKVYIESDSRGILLRGKFICRLDNRFRLRSELSEAFYTRIQSEEDITLRFVEVG